MGTIIEGTDILSEDECWELLARASVGRIAIHIGDQPDILPINYVVDGGTIVFRTMHGTKLAVATLQRNVAFEIDGFEPHGRTAWSVVVQGWTEVVRDLEEIFEAAELPLYPWISSPTPTFVRIHPRGVTGRRFHVLEKVTPDGSIGWQSGD